MRVVAGLAKGRKLKSSTIPSLRPTADKVKEALFDILGTEVRDSCFLDLFAGTGGVGIEALSRGSRQVTFVEKMSPLVELIRTNLSMCGFTNYEIIQAEVLKILPSLHKQQKKFNIVFIDPPYHSELAMKTLEAVATYDILEQDHLIIIEHDSKTSFKEQVGEVYSFRVKKFGDTSLSFYLKKGEKQESYAQSHLSGNL